MEKDSMILGRIKEIHKYKLIISLPHNRSGTCQISNISEEYNKLLNQLINDDSIMNEVAELNQLFVKGQIVQLRLTKNPNNKKHELSMIPSQINGNMKKIRLKLGNKLQVAIKSREDKGYILETGIGGLNGFLPFDQCSNAEYKVGKIIEVFPCSTPVEEHKSSRVINFTVDLQKRGPILSNTDQQCDFDAILPGMLIKTFLKLTTTGSLEGKFHGYPVTIQPDHHRITEKISTEQTMCVIDIDLSLKQLDCSLLSHLKPPFKGSNELLNVQIGYSEKNCVLTNRDKNKIYFSIPDVKYALGIVLKSHIGSDIQKLDINEKLTVRYLEYNLVDNVIHATTLNKLLSQSYFSIYQAKLGEHIKGTVVSFSKHGFTVKISSNLTGLIPIPHLSDKPMQNAQKLFSPGDEIQCRVFHIDLYENRLLLTTKKSLMKSTLPVVSVLEDLKVDMMLDGFVAKILDFGLVVILFNNLKGWVPIGRVPESKQKSLKVSYYVGKPVQVKVIRYDIATKKVELSLKNETNEDDEVADPENSVEVGDIYEAVITKIRVDGYNVRLCPTNKVAFLPCIHLSDSREHRKLFEAHFNTSEKKQIKISVVVININNIQVIVSKKKSLIDAAVKNELLKNKNSLSVDSQCLGWVVKIESYGLLIELPSGVKGLVRNKDISDLTPIGVPARELFEIGDTVMAKVIELDPLNPSRILFTLQMSATYRASEHLTSSINFIINHLEERQYIKSTVLCQKVSKLNIGDLVQVLITKQCDWGYTLQLTNDNEVTGFVRNQHLPNSPIAQGSVQRAIIIDIDLKDQAIEVSMINPYVNAVAHKRIDRTCIEINQKIPSDVLCFNKDFVVSVFQGHAGGNIVFIPTKRFWNDTAKESMWVVKQRNSTVVKTVLTNEVFIGSLAINEPINSNDSQIVNIDVPFKNLPRKIKPIKDKTYPSYFHSVSKTKVFYYISKIQRGFCYLLEYSSSIEELQQIIEFSPQRFSLLKRPVKITNAKKDNGIVTGSFLTKDNLEVGDIICGRIISVISKAKYILKLPFNNKGCIDVKKLKKKYLPFTPKNNSIVQCRIIEITKKGSKTLYYLSLYGIKELQDKDQVEDKTEETNNENEDKDNVEQLADEENENQVEESNDMECEESGCESEIEDESDENDDLVSDTKSDSETDQDIPIVLTKKEKKINNTTLSSLYKRIHQSDDEEVVEESVEVKSEPTPAKVMRLTNVKKEILIRAAEKRRETGESLKNPTTETEFELLLFNQPHDSVSWIKFINFHLENNKNVDKARFVAERAMKVLLANDIENRFQVMKKYILLEIDELVAKRNDATYDEQLSRFRKLCQRAMTQKAKLMYIHVCKNLIAGKLFDLAEELAKRFIKDFPQDPLSWYQLFLIRFLQKKYSVVKETLVNAQRSLNAADFRDLNIRVAQAEIEYGDVTRGVQALVAITKSRQKDVSLKNRIISILETNNLSQYVPEVTALSN